MVKVWKIDNGKKFVCYFPRFLSTYLIDIIQVFSMYIIIFIIT